MKSKYENLNLTQVNRYKTKYYTIGFKMISLIINILDYVCYCFDVNYRSLLS